MKAPRFSIAALMGAIAAVAVALSALRDGSELVANLARLALATTAVVGSACLVYLGGSVLGHVLSDLKHRV